MIAAPAVAVKRALIAFAVEGKRYRDSLREAFMRLVDWLRIWYRGKYVPPPPNDQIAP